MINLRIPAPPSGVGEYIKNLLTKHGMARSRLSRNIGMDYNRLNEIMSNKARITECECVKIEKQFRIRAERIMRLRAEYFIWGARNKKKMLTRFNNIVNEYDLSYPILATKMERTDNVDLGSIMNNDGVGVRPITIYEALLELVEVIEGGKND